ncbi:GNAT family N-acetyltransferase [Marinobacter arenosus]|uniref:GNAT family N-acetyltransferase n=1 Tax=Marinobacter arenosus TaxID=2856822 RepID=UPI001C4BA664|nr:GNAT family N-acetyltransferase [Marinobacter arenosus]MBW0146424.1 GNAT family N-acetyltransferase [Marinobacter arenosus]
MELKIIRGEEEFSRIQPEWDAFVAKLAPAPLPLTHGWLLAWWKAFAVDMEMEFRCAYSNGELVGIAPLVRTRERYRGIPITLLKLAANGHSPYSSIIVDASLTPSDSEAVYSALTRIGSRELGLFFKIDQASELRRFLTDRTKPGHERVLEKPSLKTPVVDIEGSWEEFYQSKSRSLKKSLNHKLNRFRSEGDFTIDHEKITGADQPIIDELIEISANSWKSSIGNDLRSNQRSRHFLLNLVGSFGKSGDLSAWIVRHKTTPVAFELHLTLDDVVYPIRADYDERFKAYSPGSVLEYAALKNLFENGLYRQYYTCADDYWYLSKWTSDYRNFCSVELFGDSLKLRTLYFVECRVIPVIKRAIRSTKTRLRTA